MPQSKRIDMTVTTGEQARALRKKLGLNQMEFWGRVGTTQSGGSRYESQGRGIPESVLTLLQIAYGTDRQARVMVERLRRQR